MFDQCLDRIDKKWALLALTLNGYLGSDIFFRKKIKMTFKFFLSLSPNSDFDICYRHPINLILKSESDELPFFSIVKFFKFVWKRNFLIVLFFFQWYNNNNTTQPRQSTVEKVNSHFNHLSQQQQHQR